MCGWTDSSAGPTWAPTTVVRHGIACTVGLRARHVKRHDRARACGLENADTRSGRTQVAAPPCRRHGSRPCIRRRPLPVGRARKCGELHLECWVGTEPPNPNPVFVLTHHEREPLVLGETETFHVRDRRHRLGDRQAKAAAMATLLARAERAPTPRQGTRVLFCSTRSRSTVVPAACALHRPGACSRAVTIPSQSREDTTSSTLPCFTHLRYRVVRSWPQRELSNSCVTAPQLSRTVSVLVDSCRHGPHRLWTGPSV